MTEPAYIFDPDDWEWTARYDERNLLLEDRWIDHGKVKLFGTLIEGPPRYAVNVIVSLDDYGDPDETEFRWFDTLDDAEAAIAAQPQAPKDPGA